MIKYIIESLAVVVADQQHKFNFEPSDYTDAQITNDSIYETLFSYLGKLLNVSFVGQPLSELDSLMGHLEKHGVSVSYSLCSNFSRSESLPRWVVGEVSKMDETKCTD